MDDYAEDRLGAFLECSSYIHNAYNSAFELMEYYCIPELDYSLSDRAEFIYRALSKSCGLEYRDLPSIHFERFLHYMRFVFELNNYMDTGVSRRDSNRIIFLLIQCYNNKLGKALRKNVYLPDIVKVLAKDRPSVGKYILSSEDIQKIIIAQDISTEELVF
jgi:hypothetical protein